MKVGIIGTRGIPNNYGGFEKLTEFLAEGLVEMGHEVHVYNPHYHEYREKQWKGIFIVHMYDPEKTLGTSGQFIYDLNCIWHARKQHFDAVVNLGYTSSSIWLGLLYGHTRIITNMDGLEWKRSKYNRFVRRFLMTAERLAVKRSNDLIADSTIIQDYLDKKYKVKSDFIAYGAELFNDPDEKILSGFGVGAYNYNMLIARMEPENNIEMILDGVKASGSAKKFFVVGNTANKFGTYLREKFSGEKRIVFSGSIYDVNVICNLRYFSNLYFHGHSVGGTNPSLLEAMGCNCPIAAHDNPFNKSILGEDAAYFANAAEIAGIIDHFEWSAEKSRKQVAANFEKIRTNYSWPKVIGQYEELILRKKQ